jgi:uncharacterized protein YbaP (TraB family)
MTGYRSRSARCACRFRWALGPAALALAACAATLPAREVAQKLPMWQVTDPSGHSLYLVASMHALETGDYPLPAPMTAAFARSDVLVEEVDFSSISHADVVKTAAAMGMLPPGETLESAMGADWERARSLAATAGVNLANFSRLKPWFAAVAIGTQTILQADYDPNLGLDVHFALLAQIREMQVKGLETMREQMSFFDDIPLPVQRDFLLQTLAQTPAADDDLVHLHAAWRGGDTEAMEKIADQDFARFPQLRNELLTDRNERWLPALKECLASGKTCFVVVGAEHMTGPDGLPALMADAGDRVRQLDAAAAVGSTR